MNHSLSVSSARPLKYLIARAIAVSALLVVLPSCGIPPRRKAEPGPVLPPTFNGAISAESSAELGSRSFTTTHCCSA